MLWLLLVAGLGLEAEAERLGDASVDVRDRAREVLLAAGAEAVPALRKALSSRDVEVRRVAAHILDDLVQRSQRAGRNNPPYRIPASEQVQTLRTLQGLAGGQSLLEKPEVMRQFSKAYGGKLHRWADPTLQDYNGLCVSLAAYVARSAEDGKQGLHVFDNLLACGAILWKLEQLGTDLPKGDWTTLWIVRRTLLVEVAVAVGRRGKHLTRAETAFYERLLKYIEPLCDDVALGMRRQLATRLSKLDAK